MILQQELFSKEAHRFLLRLTSWFSAPLSVSSPLYVHAWLVFGNACEARAMVVQVCMSGNSATALRVAVAVAAWLYVMRWCYECMHCAVVFVE